ncbi:LysR family transcriptional regulator [Erwinia tracheiphila]|nr:LysR family transcriptional regulator [Erwinia tracheiphila]UIA85632.1 LysR family transcriptional regulator [Erwinia tracheiphila]UIA90151.1 LysR family transcriptional regulator [Erwinia tracheiphila]UIA94164.1 LysR family transcriptional regulator [Erwinia tracheiphila]UIA98676.1 LysR family transcriptional regulator [Erwinia tracheiphila]
MLRKLKTFVAISQTGTFAAAGQQIGLPQSPSLNVAILTLKTP